MSSSPPPDRSLFKHSLQALMVIAGFMLPMLAGCPGSLEGTFPSATGSGGMSGGGTGGGGVCDAPNQVLKPTCGVAGCHQGGVPFMPNLSDDPLASHLVGMAAATSTAPCAGLPLIDANNPSASVILTRINGGTCGPQMPYFLPALSAANIACVTSWVMAQ